MTIFAKSALALACLTTVAFSAPHVILITQQKGFDHPIADGSSSLIQQTFQSLAHTNSFDLQYLSDAHTLPAHLAGARVVVFYTTGELPLTDPDLAALDKWVKQGGSILAIHGASDTLRLNPVWHNLIGATYDGHPWNASDTVTLKIQDPTFPACKPFGPSYTLPEEIDQQKNYDPKSVHELISVDMERTAHKATLHIPVAWCRDYEKGKIFYTNLGHNESTWQNPAFQQHLAGALNWLLNIDKADAKPNPEVSAREDAITKKLAIPGTGLPAVPEGLTLSTFAQAPQFHSPSSMCVSPDGRVFVGEDEYNTSNTDRRMGIARVKMLTSTKGDRKADKVTIFADKICAPQGMTYVNGTLYVVNAPFLTAFRDTNGDGVADERHDLITGFGPIPEGLVHHIPSGIHMGIDGFLYISCGDKGIVKATGTDGRTISLHGGGVVRVRPDGSELEVFSSGSRNPFSPAPDPYMNIFMRDNTNDGGGWNSRLSQMQRSAQYGYPSLFVNFPDEIIPCLVDYGAGGATGAVFVHEPSLPKPYGDSLYTIDWGRSFVYRHNLTPSGATFIPTQEEFLFGNFPTSIDADARGRLYISNWGRMSWGDAPPTGSIYELQSENWNVPPMPEMSTLTDAQLLHEIISPSAVTRREAQSEILKRNNASLAPQLLSLAKSPGHLDARVAALFTYAQLARSSAMPGLASLWRDPSLREFALRAMADRPTIISYANASLFAASLNDPSPRVRTQAAIAIGKSNRPDLAPYLIPLTADKDIMARHAAQQSLRELNAIDSLLTALDSRVAGVSPASPEMLSGILRTLRTLHDPRVITALSQFIPTASPALKKDTLKTLERLYTVEAAWDGSWWATVPDTRGPNYKPARWSGSEAVGNLFIPLLNDPNQDVAKSALAAVSLVRATEAAPALAALIQSNGPLKSDATRALIELKSSSPESLAAMETVTTTPGWDDALINDSLNALGSIDSPAAQLTLLHILKKLDAEEKPRPAILTHAADTLAARPATGDLVPPTTDLLSAHTPAARIAAATSLMRSADPAAKQSITQAWQTTSDAELEALLIATSRITPDAAKPYASQVQSFLKDPRISIRHAAITASARPGDTSAVASLLTSAKSYKDRDTAALALSDIDPAKSTPEQILHSTGLIADTASSYTSSPDKDAYNKLLAAAQKYLADPRVPRDRAATWMKSLKQTGVIAEYSRTDPIPLDPANVFTFPLPPDKSPAGPFASFPANGKTFDWKPTLVTDPTGLLPIDMPTNSVVFLTATQTAPTSGPAVLTTGFDDGCQIWLNGKQVLSQNLDGALKADQYRVLVQLQQGTNTLLFRLDNHLGVAGVQSRLRQRTTDFDPAELEQLAKEIPGDPARGRAVFDSAGCIKCHATAPGQSPKGPYLGEASTRFQRSHIIESILRPSAKIAQGYATTKITATSPDGTPNDYLGWVTNEAADSVTLSNILGPTTIQKSKITSRTELPQSMMPEGLMTTVPLQDFSSLLAYLSTLNNKP
ncbi:MAG TPA: ThuA domain-containing protein [Tepidisphaeraceae bacterium]|nr:ThuA domain-containing protein [Tepidisphaeraceae bacterium]